MFPLTTPSRTSRPRNVSAIVPLDWYGGFGPDQTDLRAASCDVAAFEYEQVSEGVTDTTNDFAITLGQLAASVR